MARIEMLAHHALIRAGITGFPGASSALADRAAGPACDIGLDLGSR